MTIGFGGTGFGFSSPITGNQGQLNVPQIKSPDYVPGVSGWAIFRNGNVEFNNGIFRGLLSANAITAASIGDTTIVGSDYQGGTMEETNITFDTVGGRILLYATTTVTQTFNASNSFTVPAGITALTLQGWGNGGKGAVGFPNPGANGGGSGSGGEYAKDTLPVTPLGVYPFTMGPGIPTVFNADSGTSLVAHCGNNATGNGISGGGPGGTGSVNAIHFDGGAGADGASLGPFGAGGGSSGGTSSSGNPGQKGTSSAVGLGGPAVPGGGAGSNGAPASNNSSNGFTPGGGSGGVGGNSSGHVAGAGGQAQLTISYVSARTLIGSISAVSGSDGMGNNYPSGFMAQLLELLNASAPAAVAGASQLYAANGQLATVNPAGLASNISGSQLAQITPNVVTQAVLTTIASASIPAGDAEIGAIYRLVCSGDGTFGTTQASNALQFQASIGAAPVSLGTFTVGSTFTAISTGFRWKIEVEAVCVSTGSGGTWLGGLSGRISITGANLLPAVGANASMGMAAGVTAAQTLDTTVAETLALQTAWAATTGAPTMTCRYRYFSRIA
jgi:hypothetical protein